MTQSSKDVSVIIAARQEKYLNKTVENVLANMEANSEIIVICDGNWPYEPIPDNPRVTIIYHAEPRGQRVSINEGARIAQGKYIMKLDAHCAVDKGFDKKLMADCEYDWTVVPRMYNLDINTFTPKLFKKTDYMYIGWNDKGELRSLYYSGSEWKKWHKRKNEIDDTMGCMGPGWFMHKDRFWEVGGCDENQGGKAGWGQQGIEVACKAWLSGGALKVNKKTWFAHWFRGHIGFPYEISGKEIADTRKYSQELWLQNKWEKQILPFKYLIDKFNPPTWDGFVHTEFMPKDKDLDLSELNRIFYKHVHLGKRWMKWRGTPIIKLPTDMVIYEQVIWQNKPDIVIDVGTKFGGTALFFQDMLDIVGNGGYVISIDKFPVEKVKDPRITYIEDGSTSDATLNKIRELAKGKTVMVVLDGDHRRQQVKRELVAYSDIVTKGQYLVVEDCYDKNMKWTGPGEAKDWFLKKNKKLKQTNLDNQFLIGYCRDGWLVKQ